MPSQINGWIKRPRLLFTLTSTYRPSAQLSPETLTALYGKLLNESLTIEQYITALIEADLSRTGVAR